MSFFLNFIIYLENQNKTHRRHTIDDYVKQQTMANI